MRQRRSVLSLITVWILLVLCHTSAAQHYTDWTGFEFSILETEGYSGSAVFYEVQRDYTIDLKSYFSDGSKMPEGTGAEAGFYASWANILPPCDWDFVSLDVGGILTIKKGYRWDGPSYPCFLGIELTDHHMRSSLIHDALYDLMRMGYLAADHWDVQDNRLDPNGVDNAGDHNRRMADMLIYMIGVEDGQVIGDGGPFGFGDALTDYLILRAGGRSATHNNNKLTEWKYHSFELTAYATDGKVELEWKRPDAAAKDPNFWEHFNPFKAYTVLRNGSPLITIEVSAPYPLPPVFATSWIDNTVVNGTAYSYQVVPFRTNTNQYDWTNTDVAMPVPLSGNALVLDGIDDYVEANTVSHDLVYQVLPGMPVPLTMEAWVYPEAQTINAAVLAFNTFAGGNENMLIYSGDSSKFYHYAPGSATVMSATPSPPGSWYHVAVTIDIANHGTLYVNGSPEASFIAAVKPSHGSRFSIGQEWDVDTTSAHFKGMVDEVRIWNVTRSGGDIVNAMNTPLRGDEAGLIALWHSDDPNDLFVPISPPFADSTRKVYDATHNASDGNLFGYAPADTPFVRSGAMGQVAGIGDEGGGHERGQVPDDYAVHQNYPNPFNPSTVIEFDLPRASHVTVTIFNLLGQKVVELANGRYPAGAHEIAWNGLDSGGKQASTGTYFYRLVAGDFINTKKMILLK